MAYDFEFTSSAADDLNRLIQHHPTLATQLITRHVPAIVRDPKVAGEKKKGDLASLRAYAFTLRGVTHRVVYAVDDARQLVTIVAISVHDEAYRRARSR